MSQIVVVTSLPDPHVDMVRKHLPASVTLEIFDPKVLSCDGKITITEKGSIKGIAEDPLSVWYRKPRFLEENDLEGLDIPKDYYKSLLSLNREAYSLVYGAYPKSFWVSNPYAIKRASNKLTQLILAQELGFNIPKTIFSSDKEEIEVFRKHLGDIILKPLGLPYARVEGVNKWLFATLVKSSQVLDYTGIGITPMIFQERIVKTADLRVTVIGNEVFVCKIVSKDVDWRVSQSDSNTLYSPFSLEDKYINKCIEMVRKLGLAFGALDFVLSEEGNLYFLEINPNGQWGFVEKQTKQPLSMAMAKLLMRSP